MPNGGEGERWILEYLLAMFMLSVGVWEWGKSCPSLLKSKKKNFKIVIEFTLNEVMSLLGIEKEEQVLQKAL